MVDRRRLLVAGAASLAVAAYAETRRRTARVGILFNIFPLETVTGPQPSEPVMQYFLEGMRDAGYLEGANLVLERRTAAGRLDRLEMLARELAALPVDVIVVSGNAATIAAKKATSRVPIVSAGMANPVKFGIVEDLARPKGNVTGSAPTFGPEVRIKQMEVVHRLVPHARRVVHLSTPLGGDIGAELDLAAARLGFANVYVEVGATNIDAALDDAFEEVRRAKVDALLVAGTAPLYPFRRRIVDFAARTRLADVYGLSEAVDAGGLGSYGGDTRDAWRRAARYTQRILAGAKPGDLPIEQTQRYVLALNRCRAQTLGIDIPEDLVRRADHVVC